MVCGGCKVRKCCGCEEAPQKSLYKRKSDTELTTEIHETVTDATEVSQIIYYTRNSYWVNPRQLTNLCAGGLPKN